MYRAMAKSRNQNKVLNSKHTNFDGLIDSNYKIYQTIVDRMEQGVLVHDGSKIVCANSQLCKILDCPSGLVDPGSDLEDYIQFAADRGDYADSSVLTLQSLRMRIAAGKDYVVERNMPDGRIIRIDCRNDGRFGISTYTDVTEAKKQSDILETTIDSLAQGLLVYEDKKIIMANSRLGELLNLPNELMKVGVTLEDMLRFRAERGDYKDNDRYVERINEAFDAGISFTRETQACSKTLLTECRYEHSMMFVTFTDITDARNREILLEEKEVEVRRIAEIDVLTGLSNRRAFDNELSSRLTKFQNSTNSESFALILIDLDRFKAINDTHGHGAGDALLQELSKRFRSAVRDIDIVSRIGGDEFAVIVDISDYLNVEEVAERLLVAARSTIIVDHAKLRADASIGVAIHTKDMTNVDDILTAADLALYDAKGQGKGTVRFYESSLSEQAAKRYQIEQDLHSALVNNEFFLQYQVQRDLKTNEDIGYEALMRWLRPDVGMVSPGDFISIAEETGAIVEMGRWALQKATADIAKLDDKTRVAVNVSPAQFVKSDLVHDVKYALSKSGLSPHRLEVEVTEDLLIEDTGNTLKILNQLRDIGISVSLDDFGSGYSSLAYLTQFPFTKLKIDRSFIDRMSTDERSKSLVKSILVLASSLGLTVTAEGVETQAQLSMLRNNNCDEAQGFLLGKPGALGGSGSATAS